MTSARRDAVTRRQSPDRPPVFASTRTSVMRGGLVDRLDHVDQRQRGDGDAGQRLHLDAGAVGGAHRGAQIAPRRRRPRGRPRRRGWRSGGTAGPGRASAWRPGCRRSGRRRARRPWARRRRAAAATTSAGQQDAPGRGRGAGRDVLAATTSTMRAAPASSRWVSSSPRACSGDALDGTEDDIAPRRRRSTRGDVLGHDDEGVGRGQRRRPGASPAPPTGRDDVAPVARRRSSTAGELPLRPAGEVQSLRGDGVAPVGRCSGSTPSIRRSTGRTNTSNETYGADRVAGQREDRRAGRGRWCRSPAACPAASRPGRSVTVPEPGEHLLDDVVGADADPAAGDHQVGADQLVLDRVQQQARRRRGTMPTRKAMAPGLARGGGEDVGVASRGSGPAAAACPGSTSSLPVDRTTTRGRGRTTHPVAADRGEQAELPRPEPRAGRAAPTSPACTSSPAAPDVPRRPRRPAVMATRGQPAVGPLDRDDGVGAAPAAARRS